MLEMEPLKSINPEDNGLNIPTFGKVAKNSNSVQFVIILFLHNHCKYFYQVTDKSCLLSYLNSRGRILERCLSPDYD